MLEVRLSGRLEGREAVMVAGLPGMGYVAKQAANYLIEETRAAPFGEVSSPYLYPPVVLFNDGVLETFLDRKLYRFYLAKLSNMDLLIFTGEAQPSSAEGQRMLADEVAKAVAEAGVRKVFTMAAYPVPGHVEEPKVYVVATSSELLRDLVSKGLTAMPGRSSISGMNGLLLEYVAKRSIEGACLLSETYVIDAPDVKAAAALVKALKKILKIEVDVSRIEEVARRFDEDLHRQYELLRKTEEVERKLGYIY
ncbi:MAG: PAC2 family protein [Candidatus Nezhaarchaeota archaeon]|nr:PAC2 family protein [Candidatus Nezhaarchaeota archaeon]